MKTDTCFLLTHDSRDIRGHFEIHLHAVSSAGHPVKIVIDNFQPLFFVPHDTPVTLTEAAAERKKLPLQSMNNTPVDCLYFKTYSASLSCARLLRDKAFRTFEADVYPTERYLMERQVLGGFSIEGSAQSEHSLTVYHNPKIRGTDVPVVLTVLSLDIETNAANDNLYSIACSGNTNRVFIIGDAPDDATIRYCHDEHALLVTFLAYLTEENPDVIIGWNIINFDLLIIQKRCNALAIPFSLGRDSGATIAPQKEGSKTYVARIPGRVIIDVPTMLRANAHTFERYSLDFVASQLLGKNKLIEQTGQEKIEEINRLFHEDKTALASYNLEDAILTKEIFDTTNLLPNAIERSRNSGHLIDQYGGSVAAFDYLYLPRLHRAGYVAGNTADVTAPVNPLTGGHVMESKPGIYENVVLLDFKSLYPTIIMTFCIDPLGAQLQTGKTITGPTGNRFASDIALLPGIIAELMQARASAKKTNNQPLSYAIKILMNSFYGVLGSPGCRFFSPDLAQAITGTGQYILKTTCAYIEKQTSFSVIYGDTDSLFVLLGPQHQTDAETIGKQIASDVNLWLTSHIRELFHAESHLELEFETHFIDFLMPTIRGSTQGSKKRYCGTIEKNGKRQLHFKGMESARSDWTVLAKDFQATLYMMVFRKEPVEEYIITTVNQVRSGAMDDKLVYQKQIRKPLHEYTATIPPHIQAAKQLEHPGHSIRYVITLEGPQPEEKITASLDYEHYIEAQLRPVADSILEWINLNFDSIISGQQDLFDGR